MAVLASGKSPARSTWFKSAPGVRYWLCANSREWYWSGKDFATVRKSKIRFKKISGEHRRGQNSREGRPTGGLWVS
jgi:hypothetical protein